MVSMKNTLATPYGFKGFCGSVLRMKWYAGFYYEDDTESIDYGATLLLHWVG